MVVLLSACLFIPLSDHLFMTASDTQHCMLCIPVQAPLYHTGCTHGQHHGLTGVLPLLLRLHSCDYTLVITLSAASPVHAPACISLLHLHCSLRSQFHICMQARLSHMGTGHQPLQQPMQLKPIRTQSMASRPPHGSGRPRQQPGRSAPWQPWRMYQTKGRCDHTLLTIHCLAYLQSCSINTKHVRKNCVGVIHSHRLQAAVPKIPC